MARVLSPSGIPLTTPASGKALNPARASATDFGAPQAQALDEAGRGLQALGVATAKLAEKRKAIEDTAFLDRADLELDLTYSKVLDDEQGKARSGAEGMTDSVRQRFENETQSVLEKLRTEGGYRPSEDATRLVQSLVLRRQREHLRRAAAYEHNERIRFIGEQLDNSVVQIAHQGAVSGDVGSALKRAEQSISAYEGILPPAELAEMRRRAATHFYNQMAANVDPEAALEYARRLTAVEPRTEPAKDDAIGKAAQSAGVDDAMLRVFARIESGGKANARTGSYKGLFQLSDSEFEKYGGGDIYNAEDNAMAAARKLKAEAARFEQRHGRAPTPTDLYLTHQQGEAGYAAHLSNPDAPAWQNMLSTGEGKQKGERWAKAAIWGNVPDGVKKRFGNVDNITSADFIKLWDEKVQRFGGKSLQLADSSVRGALARTLSEKGPELVKAAEAAREKRIDAERAVRILSGDLPVDPGSEDDRKTIDKAFRNSPFLEQLNSGDWQAADQLTQLASRISYVPKEAFETLRGMTLNGDPTQRHFAYQTLGSIMRERPGALQAGGGKGFTKDVADEVETFNTMVADAGIPPAQAIERIDEMRSPDFQKRRESLKKEANDIVKELTIDDITKEYSGIFTSRPDAGGSDRRAAFMLDAYRDMVRYHYTRTADPELAKQVALNEMKRAYGVSTITGNKRLMRNRPEQFYPAIPSRANADPSYEYFTDELKRAVNEAAGRLAPVEAGTGMRMETALDEIPLEDIYLESTGQTQADIAAGNPYPSYSVVWRQKDENGIPQLMTAPGPFYVDVAAAQKRASEARRRAMARERTDFLDDTDRREEFRQRREEVAKDPMKIFDNLKDDLMPDALEPYQGEPPAEFQVSP